MDLDILQDFPTKAERLKWLKKAKAELLEEAIQARVDAIAEAAEENDDLGLQLLTNAFPEDLKLHSLTASQHKRWIKKAALAANRAA